MLISGESDGLRHVGVDGCRAGWFAVELTDYGEWSIHLHETFAELAKAHVDGGRILVDIPIGLRESGVTERLCDLEGRRLLGKPRSASVFPAPCRSALCAVNYPEARHINREHTGRGLSIQTWHILRKIREVDEMLQQNAAARANVAEIHPEVLFWALNDARSMQYSKRRNVGIEERLDVLRRHFEPTLFLLEGARERFLKKDVANDDILDALAAAITSQRAGDSLKSIPEYPEMDSVGLPMQMVYWGC